ncbi:ATP synthase F1 subunit delta, partial [bacterium]|nr:ATP synthase F1 subunit delta [bacterium]
FGPRLEPVLLDFFNLLLDRNRIELLRDIGEVFAELVEADGGLVRARVVTAIALPADLETKLRDKLAQVTGKNVVLEKKVDPAVLGGVCVTLGDRIIDGTVRTNLDRLRKKLATAQVRG